MATNELDLLSIEELTEARARATKLMSTGALNRHVTSHLVELLDNIDKAVARKHEAARFTSLQPEPEPA
ncbi:MAG: hypothetical protein JO345_14225 [Streptosporangiaceae bacterium]|nr:hypothetical protein [Streptosporangiaceae bacterium]